MRQLPPGAQPQTRRMPTATTGETPAMSARRSAQEPLPASAVAASRTRMPTEMRSSTALTSVRTPPPGSYVTLSGCPTARPTSTVTATFDQVDFGLFQPACPGRASVGRYRLRKSVARHRQRRRQRRHRSFLGLHQRTVGPKRSSVHRLNKATRMGKWSRWAARHSAWRRVPADRRENCTYAPSSHQVIIRIAILYAGPCGARRQ
jgi:hypothetical protein